MTSEARGRPSRREPNRLLRPGARPLTTCASANEITRRRCARFNSSSEKGPTCEDNAALKAFATHDRLRDVLPHVGVHP